MSKPTLPDDIKQLVEMEVRDTYDLSEFNTFEDFWDDVDATNFFEDEWEGWKVRGIKEIYKQVFKELTK